MGRKSCPEQIKGETHTLDEIANGTSSETDGAVRLANDELDYVVQVELISRRNAACS